MTDPRTQARSILGASPRAARWAWIVNGSLFAIGASVSTFVYLSAARGGKEIMHVGRAGYVWVESVESQLFTLPFFQLVLFLMPLMMDVNWRRFQSVIEYSEQLRRARDPGSQQVDMVLLYLGVCFMLVLAGIIAFGLALSAAWWGYARSSLQAG